MKNVHQIIWNAVRLYVQLSQFILSVASYVRFFFHYSSFASLICQFQL